MKNIGSERSELIQLQIFVGIITIIQSLAIYFYFSEISFLYLIPIFVAISLNLAIIIGLYLRKIYSLYLGYIFGAIGIMASIFSINLFGIIIYVLWIWSFARISSLLKD